MEKCKYQVEYSYIFLSKIEEVLTKGNKDDGYFSDINVDVDTYKYGWEFYSENKEFKNLIKFIMDEIRKRFTKEITIKNIKRI